MSASWAASSASASLPARRRQMETMRSWCRRSSASRASRSPAWAARTRASSSSIEPARSGRPRTRTSAISAEARPGCVTAIEDPDEHGPAAPPLQVDLVAAAGEAVGRGDGIAPPVEGSLRRSRRRRSRPSSRWWGSRSRAGRGRVDRAELEDEAHAVLQLGDVAVVVALGAARRCPGRRRWRVRRQRVVLLAVAAQVGGVERLGRR